ncbi:MAG: hypothetical protein LBQ59_04045 [Candidatus Peribacteria bacterium]|nr:hypothetical protein [Candidatus Peribacteria bacterium]
MWYKSINDLELNQFLSSGQFLLSREAEEEYYDNISKDKNKINFSIYLNTDKKVI